MERLNSAAFHLPKLIDSRRYQVLVMTDHQDSALESRQPLQEVTNLSKSANCAFTMIAADSKAPYQNPDTNLIRLKRMY